MFYIQANHELTVTVLHTVIFYTVISKCLGNENNHYFLKGFQEKKNGVFLFGISLFRLGDFDVF